MKKLALVLSILLLNACGGGGGGSASNSDVSVATTPIALGLTDTFAFSAVYGGGGVWNGSSSISASGEADGGGGAGDGEFIQVKANFPYSGNPTGTLYWKDLRSQYGIGGTYGTLNIQVDSTNGGYKVISASLNGGAFNPPSANQQNIFVSTNGIISGTVPLPIGSGQDTPFTASRFADTPVGGISALAGQYVYGSLYATAGTGANPSVGHGILYINPTGATATSAVGRVCTYPATTYSPTCPGFDVNIAYNSPPATNVVQITLAPTQSIATNQVGFSLLAVFKSYGSSGLSFSGDFATTTNGNTGIIYGSRIPAVAITPASFVGTYATSIISNFNAGNISGLTHNYGAADVQSVTGSIRLADINQANSFNCTTAQANESVITAGPNNGSLTLAPVVSTGSYPTYVIQIDVDTYIGVNADSVAANENFSLIRTTATPPVGASGGICAPI